MSRIDLSKPPYQVPCPLCGAFAMAPCTNPLGGILEEPDDARWMSWGTNPRMRVKVTQDTWVRWQETFREWAKRMIIHCPTARTYGELMFFAAEKLNMTTEEYRAKYFPELVPKEFQRETLKLEGR